nr:hypothetical protein Iba_chr11bCG13010 [Ipomoea batatas]
MVTLWTSPPHIFNDAPFDVSTREHIVRAGYGYFVDFPTPHIFNDAPFDALEVQDRRPNVPQPRGNVQGEPGRGGRRMRAINQVEQAEANQHRHDADDDDGGFEDVNALTIVPVPYRADEQNCEPQAFTSGVEIDGSSHSTAWEQSTSSCPSTTYCYPHSQGATTVATATKIDPNNISNTLWNTSPSKVPVTHTDVAVM